MRRADYFCAPTEMGQVFFMYFFPLTVALGFIWVSIHLLSKPKSNKNYSRLPIVHLVVGIVLAVWIVFFTATPWTRWKIVRRALYSKAQDVQLIEILPTEHDSLIDHRILVDSRADIDRLVAALNTATGQSPNHPRASWSVELVVHTKDGATRFTVEQTTDGGNGTIVGSFSDAAWKSKLNIGDYRCDALTEALETLAHR